jgi:signal transduction histidine kinase/CheY-like chemotaxis protein/HPt (histidine-containing phosphotransfer) domain-containing protein
MAPWFMSQTTNSTSIAPRHGSRVPTRLLQAAAGLLILVLIAADVTVLLRLREDALVSTETHMSTIALTLAEQADRAVQSIDLVLDGVARLATTMEVSDETGFDRILSDRTTHEALRQRLIGLPQLNALILYGLDGRVVNSSRSWPVPSINISDADYFKSLTGDKAANFLITTPFRYKTDGTWTLFLIRKFRGADGRAAGLMAAAIELRYFQDFYRAVSVGDDGTISLLRDDGMQLTRYPPAPTTGQSLIAPRRILGTASAGTIRDPSPFDGTMRVKAARRLTTYPLILLVTLSVAEALGDWWDMVWTLGLGTGACCAAIVIAAVAVGRRWQHGEALSEERESRALAEAALMRERERSAENESRAKSGFLAMMSHEIRTPMNGVLGLTGTLLDTPLNEEQRKTVGAIRDSGDALLRILNDILDFSKLESGRMELEEIPFSPATLTQNPVSLLGPRAIAKGLRIDAVCEDGLPDAVQGDSGRIRQVLINLVSNAVKFTERGSVTIRVTCVARDEDHATLVWDVADTGIGIPADRVARLFGEFSQADASISRRFGGSGLGLAISKRLIEQMGGTISIESRPGLGSTFTVTLRLPIAEPVPDAQTAPIDVITAFQEKLRHLGRSARILFAEDNPTNQFVALQLLRGFDLQIDVVGDGLEAVRGASDFAYDVICMDMRMPEMDGLAATRAIRAMGGDLATIPIIALTANAFAEDVAACFEAGMTGFVAKPVRKETLLAALLTALDAPKPGGTTIAGAADPEQTEVALDQDAFSELTREIGADCIADMIAMFEAETRTRLTLLADRGLDRVTLVREVHTLKGAAAATCAASLSLRAAVIEQRLRHDEPRDDIDLAPLTEAFEAWRAAVHRLDATTAIAA